jgi:bacteriophage transposase
MLISAVELAGLQLPKLPNSRQGIEYHAKRIIGRLKRLPDGPEAES